MAESLEAFGQSRILAGLECQYCHCDTKLVDSSVVYGKSYGLIYFCEGCEAYVGVHHGTNKSKGSVANATLREKRKQAHAALDPLWLRKTHTRKALYKGLSRWLDTLPHETHIGMFNELMCDEVIRYAFYVKSNGIPYGLELDKARGRATKTRPEVEQ